MSITKNKPALGRGLKALLENVDTDITSSKSEVNAPVGAVSSIPINCIKANPFQPRTTFEQEALVTLQHSIEEHGIIQPVTVRKVGYDQFQLISGERRFRASQLAGLVEVPAFVRVADDESMLEMALVENLHRENLDPIEIAVSFKRLVEECHLTQEQLAQKVSKSRSAVTNFLRLLRLPAEIQTALQAGQISMGHARPLIAIENETQQLKLFRQILKESLSVRATELLLQSVQNDDKKVKPENNSTQKEDLNPSELNIKNGISTFLGAPVNLKKNKNGKGQIVIPFKSETELLRIARLLGQ